MSAKAHETSTLHASLTAACESAVMLFDAGHATYLQFDEDLGFGTVIAESRGGIRSLGSRIPLRGVPLEEELVLERRTIVVPEVASEDRLLSIREQLISSGIQSVALIPVVVDGRLVGSFSVDWEGIDQELPAREDTRFQVLADLVARTIEAHRLGEEQARARALIDNLEALASELHELQDLTKVQHALIRGAVMLLNGTSGALYAVFPRAGMIECRQTFGPWIEPHSLVNGSLHPVAVACLSSHVTQEHRQDNPTRYLVTVAIKHLGSVQHVLAVELDCTLPALEQRMMERFASRALQALLACSRLHPGSETHLRATILNRLSAFMQSQGESEQAEERMLHVLLTGVTASFGLRFNRGVVLLYDRGDQILSHALSVGQMRRETWEDAVVDAPCATPSDLDEYFAKASRALPPRTDLDERLSDFHWQVALTEDVLNRVFHDLQPVRVPVGDLPGDLRKALEAASEVAIIPILSGKNALGLLIVDNAFTAVPISPSDLEDLSRFAATAASYLQLLRANAERINSELRLRALLKASPTLLVEHSFRQVLEYTAASTCMATKATGAGIILSADGKRAWLHLSAGEEPSFPPEVVMRPDGISSRVMLTGTPEAIPDIFLRKDELNPRTSWAAYKSAICLPMRSSDVCIGVLWLLYDRRHPFEPQEVEDLQAHTNSVASAYELALRRSELYALRSAALAMSESGEAAMRRLPWEAMKFSGADYATFWIYDESRDEFLPKPICGGWEPNIEPPGPQGTTRRALQESYLAESISSRRSGRIYDMARRFGVAAFQALCVRVGSRPLGVLYLSYVQSRRFDDHDRKQAESFAALAGPLIEAERAVSEREAFRRHVEQVARRAAGGKLQETLTDIVERIQLLYGGGPILLYLIDPWTKQIHLPPTMGGLIDERATLESDQEDLERMLRTLVKLETPYLAEDIADGYREAGTIFDGTGFHLREHTRSCAVFPLRAAGYLLGLLFVNHRNKKTFAEAEMTSLEFFANQAATAILPEHLLRSSSIAIAGTTHSIRHPLGYVQRTLEGALLDVYGPIQPLLKLELQNALLRLNRVSREIRALHSLVRMEDIQPRPECFRICDLMNQIAADLARLFSDMEIEFEFENGLDHNLEMRTDRNLLENIVFLLADNAQNYTLPKGRVRLTVQQHPQAISIAVQDTGVGILESEQPRIFERLMRGSNVKDTEGSGIGLYLARYWARLMGGDVKLISSCAKGSTFEATITCSGVA